jgi:hypothetical protein
MAIRIGLDQGLLEVTSYPLVMQALTSNLDEGPWIGQPIRADENGAILVRAVSDSLGTLTTRDLTSFTDYTPAAGDIGRAGISLTWARDADDQDAYLPVDAAEIATGFAANLKGLVTGAVLHGLANDGSGMLAAGVDYEIGYNDNNNIGTAGGWLITAACGFAYNDSGANNQSYDRWRNNTNIEALASAARTASVNSADLINYNAKGLHLIIDVTAITDTPSITVEIQGKDEVSGKYYAILTSAAIVATGTTVLKVFPALTAVVNTVANDILPRIWRVSVTNADADSITYSVAANLVL